jgi:ATP-dependent protease ClpP protease subunit
MKSWFTITNAAGSTPEVMIYDDIGGYGIGAQQFRNQLNEIKAPKINLRINSLGGDCSVATAMCTAIREHDAEITAHIDGIAASAGCTVARACDRVEIAPSAFMMVHNAMCMAFGYAADLRKEADISEKYSNAVCAELAEGTGNSKKIVQQKMDAETWFNAKEAVEFGLADCIKDADGEGFENRLSSTVFNSAAFSQFKNVPEAVRVAIARSRSPQNKIETQPAATSVSAAKKEEIPMALTPIMRDGKHFVVIDGKEHEISAPANTASTLQMSEVLLAPAGKSDEEVAAAVATASAEASKKAIEGERAYRSMFNTIMATAKLTGEAAANFEKQFYGRAEADLKFLAEHAIGNRAQAVGEGSGQQEQGTAAADKAAADIRTFCVEQLAKNKTMRSAFRVTSLDPKDPTYVDGLAKFIVVETKVRADAAAPRTRDITASAEESENDPVTRVLKNKSVQYRPDPQPASRKR